MIQTIQYSNNYNLELILICPTLLILRTTKNKIIFYFFIDELEQEPIKTSIPLTSTANTVNDDQNIHVHKEGGTGGGICAKLVFFILFSALTVLIGLIITEHRGLTDGKKRSKLLYTTIRFLMLF